MSSDVFTNTFTVISIINLNNTFIIIINLNTSIVCIDNTFIIINLNNIIVCIDNTFIIIIIIINLNNIIVCIDNTFIIIIIILPGSEVIEGCTDVVDEYQSRRFDFGLSEGIEELLPGQSFPLECNLFFLNGGTSLSSASSSSL